MSRDRSRLHVHRYILLKFIIYIQYYLNAIQMFLIRLSSASNWTKIENLEKILLYILLLYISVVGIFQMHVIYRLAVSK